VTSFTAIQGTGEEICQYASKHPAERFYLISMSPGGEAVSIDPQVLARIEARRGKYPVLPDEALTTDSLYE